MPLAGTWSVWDAYSHAVSVSYFGKYVCESLAHKLPRNSVKRKGARSSPVFLTITDIREKLLQAGVSFSANATEAQLSSLLAATDNPDSGPNPPETPPGRGIHGRGGIEERDGSRVSQCYEYSC